MTANTLCRVAPAENELWTPHDALRMLVLAAIIVVAAIILAQVIAWM